MKSKRIDSEGALCMDYQKNLILPNITTNDAYYKRKLGSPSEIDNSEYHGDGGPTHAGNRSRGRGGRGGREGRVVRGGRGGSRGRGSRGDRGGRGNSGETVDEVRSDLDLVRAQRQVT
ncbi:unnamed protein product [Pieris macdunnoughi]|uniref:Uncharacterized protein n=1 Tax=Pieris macdunnoughi TaxID=345717 RepID=A0A821XD18_9NEOP|nr:unnamed protein product [Pieris macdunnoughi]